MLIIPTILDIFKIMKYTDFSNPFLYNIEFYKDDESFLENFISVFFNL